MAKFIIQGGEALRGEIRVSGNKNAILPIMAATVLTEGKCVLKNVPKIDDVLAMSKILEGIGVKVAGLGTDVLTIDTTNVRKFSLDPELVSKLRASILLLGPLVARFGRARMRHPGGCIIGRRAVGTHFDVLNALGVKVSIAEDDYEAKVQRLRPAKIFLDEASVTATENALMIASSIPGETIIDDAACEPHIEDLANFLEKMGAKILGAGTNRIIVKGANKLKATTHEIWPDYIDVGTMAVASAATKGDVEIKGIRADDLRMTLLYLKRFGVKYKLEKESLRILPSDLHSPKGKIQTRPWPGFPTDLMSPFLVLATQAKGTTLCHDWMYETRMFFTDKLISMGADITLCDPHRVLVVGPTKLRGKLLESPDIRAGMALVIAALCAQDESVIEKVEQIERGYEKIESRLKSLGANIIRKK